jgi:methylphosphotriester-DNA--protein-cysteine methyltransferase
LFDVLSGGVAQEFLRAFPSQLHPDLRTVILNLTEQVSTCPDVTTMAGWVGRTPSWLYRTLRREGLMHATELRMWARALRTLRLIETTHVNQEAAALKLGYGGANSFSDQVRKLTGQRPSRLLAQRGTRSLLEALRKRLEELRPVRPGETVSQHR